MIKPNSHYPGTGNEYFNLRARKLLEDMRGILGAVSPDSPDYLQRPEPPSGEIYVERLSGVLVYKFGEGILLDDPSGVGEVKRISLIGGTDVEYRSNEEIWLIVDVEDGAIDMTSIDRGVRELNPREQYYLPENDYRISAVKLEALGFSFPPELIDQFEQLNHLDLAPPAPLE
ncbi:MAG: hypothetical protein JSV63_02720 [Candidatus Aenigmatarchaeota archaeon]|nr:MAG: hypothetical protein JSV63_02720 [Candidatus Aenigmarchaeota archaeon]